MKAITLTTAFLLGALACAAFGQAPRSLTPPDLPGLPAPRVAPSPARPAAPRPAGVVTIEQALAPAYEAVTASEEGEDIRAALPTVKTVAALVSAASPKSEATVAAARVCAVLAEIIRQNQALSTQYNQRASTALDAGGDRNNGWIFRENTAKRWSTARTQLVSQAAPAWQKLLSAEPSDAPNYSPAFQQMLASVVAENQRLALERSAVVIEGEVSQATDRGALVQLYETRAVADRTSRVGGGGNVGSRKVVGDKTVFVAGLTGITDGAHVTVLAHRNGVFRYTTVLNAQRTVEQYNFYRAAK